MTVTDGEFYFSFVDQFYPIPIDEHSTELANQEGKVYSLDGRKLCIPLKEGGVDSGRDVTNHLYQRFMRCGMAQANHRKGIYILLPKECSRQMRTSKSRNARKSANERMEIRWHVLVNLRGGDFIRFMRGSLTASLLLQP